MALSTVTIEVVPSASVPEPIDDDNSISDAFEKGWDAFTGFVFGIGFVLAVLLPFLVLGAIAALVGWLLIRRRNRSRPIAPTTTMGGQPPPEPTQAGSATVNPDADETASRQG